MAKPQKQPLAICKWCSKKIYSGQLIYEDNYLKGFLSFGMLAKEFCSERCRNHYRKSKGR